MVVEKRQLSGWFFKYWSKTKTSDFEASHWGEEMMTISLRTFGCRCRVAPQTPWEIFWFKNSMIKINDNNKPLKAITLIGLMYKPSTKASPIDMQFLVFKKRKSSSYWGTFIYSDMYKSGTINTDWTRNTFCKILHKLHHYYKYHFTFFPRK